jgi:hypothetical protein
MHRLQRGLPGYLILFATHAFVPQRQLRLGWLLTRSVFLVVSMHFTATPQIPPAPNLLKINSINARLPVKQAYLNTNLLTRLRTL